MKPLATSSRMAAGSAPACAPESNLASGNIAQLERIRKQKDNRITRLYATWSRFIREITQLGPVITRSGNTHVMLEQADAYVNYRTAGDIGMVENGPLDLRLFFDRWRHGFAVQEETRSGVRRSFRFYDAAGSLAHEILLTDESDHLFYHELVRTYRDHDCFSCRPASPCTTHLPEKPEKHCEKLQTCWRTLRDRRDFEVLMHAARREPVPDTSSSPGTPGIPFDPEIVSLFFEEIADHVLDTTIVTGNPGCVQIRTGKFFETGLSGDVFSALDDDFAFRIDLGAVAGAQVVPRKQGSSANRRVELYDREKKVLALIWPGEETSRHEKRAWNLLVSALTAVAA